MSRYCVAPARRSQRRSNGLLPAPREEVEEWVAKADGTFARSDDSDSEEEDPWVKDAKMKDEDLAYYGF